MKITTKYKTEIIPLPVGHHLYEEDNQIYEIWVHGKNEHGEFDDLFYVTQDTIEKVLEYIHSESFTPKCDLGKGKW